MSLDTVVSLFERQVRADPQRLAIVGLQERITYTELDRRSAKVAAWLHSRNVGAGDRVLIRAERSIELVVAMLGVLKAGAAFVPWIGSCHTPAKSTLVPNVWRPMCCVPAMKTMGH